MKFSKNVIRVIAVILVILLVVGLLASAIASMTVAYGVTQAQIDELKSQRDEIHAQRDALQAQIDELRGQADSVLQLKVALDMQNELVKQDIELLTEQIDTYGALVEYKGEELTQAEADTEAQYQVYRGRIRAMEEKGSTYILDILFGSENLSDFLSRYNDISEVAEYDNRQIESYLEKSAALEVSRTEYSEMLAAQELTQAELEAEKADLEDQILSASDMIAFLEANLDIYAAQFEENEAAEQEVQSQIDDLVVQLRREEEARAAAGRGNVQSTGTFIWPTPSCYTIASVYGWREHPILGGQRFHAGVDIAAGYGAAILAADSGEVATATYSGSYGNYVILNHGNGTVTVYAHMSSIACSYGQTVSQGQVIGYVGSTGYSTGPHLHYEIRIGGGTVDPLGYYSGYTIRD